MRFRTKKKEAFPQKTLLSFFNIFISRLCKLSQFFLRCLIQILRYLNLTTAYSSPWIFLSFIDTMPLPLRRILLPDCVPGRILQTTFPVNVGTTASPPRTAVVNGIVIFVYTSMPFRQIRLCRQRHLSSRSPASPPLNPGFPLPFRRTVLPVSIPAGILTFRDCI